jgi:tetratricopeptide (TPR) repeat protein
LPKIRLQQYIVSAGADVKKAVVFIAVLLIGSAVWAQQKYALVIGNENYRDIEKLFNPVKDATDVAAKLRTLGFQVELKTNLTNADMGKAVNGYIQRLAQNKGNEGFFWYAGHGVQIDGENYLLPIDVESTDDVSVMYSSYPVNRLILSFERTAQNKVNVVVLDACRNNPFRNTPGKSRSLSRGLSMVHNLPPDLFIIYSTTAGDVAADGAVGARNSPFAEAFIRNMDSTDDLSIVVRNITRETLRLTDNKQRPYQEGSIISLDYYSLNPRKTAPVQPEKQEDATAYYNRGKEYFNKGDWDGAIREFTQAIRINPNYTEAYNQRGLAYEKKKEWDQMLADYTAANRLNPNEPRYVMNIGVYYSKTGDYERAITQFNEAIRMKPDYAFAYFNRGDAYRTLRDYDKAIADCDTAIRLDPNNKLAYGTRGEAYRMKGNYTQALNDLNKAISLDANDAWTYDVRARVYRAQGKTDLADADTATYNRLNK